MRQPNWHRHALSERASDPIVEQLGRHLDPARADRLLCAAGRGDRAAFGTLLDRTVPVILGCLRRAVSGPGQAEQVTENVYVQLWRCATHFETIERSAHQHLLDLTRCELLRWHHR